MTTKSKIFYICYNVFVSSHPLSYSLPIRRHKIVTCQSIGPKRHLNIKLHLCAQLCPNFSHTETVVNKLWKLGTVITHKLYEQNVRLFVVFSMPWWAARLPAIAFKDECFAKVYNNCEHEYVCVCNYLNMDSVHMCLYMYK